MMTGNMVETGVKRSGGQAFHAGLVGMLVTSFLFQKTHCIFFHASFYSSVTCFQFLFALEA